MRDLGTTFNVVAERGAVEVGVSEGRVLFDPDGAAVNLSPGMSLRRAAATARPIVSSTEPDVIGGWRDRVAGFAQLVDGGIGGGRHGGSFAERSEFSEHKRSTTQSQ